MRQNTEDKSKSMNYQCQNAFGVSEILSDKMRVSYEVIWMDLL